MNLKTETCLGFGVSDFRFFGVSDFKFRFFGVSDFKFRFWGVGLQV